MSFTDFHCLPASVLQCFLLPEGATEPDEITAASLQGSTLAVGTRHGRVWSLRQGEAIPRETGRHSGRILAVAVDTYGAFLASSCADGSVAVCPIPGGEREALKTSSRRPRWVCTYSRPVLSIAFSPGYASGSPGSQALCVGGEECKLIINRRGAFESRNAVVHHGEGTITCISWRGTLIAWANAKGVKIVDVETYQKVTHLSRPPADANANGCCLRWHGDNSLLIGWGSMVAAVEVVRQKAGGPTGVRFANVSQCFSLSGCAISGILAFDSNHLAILTGGEDDNGGASSSSTIAYHVCTRDGHVLSTDHLPMDGANRCLQLVSAGDGCASYIVSAQHIIATQRRSVTSHVTSLISDGEYEAAIALASQIGSMRDATQKGQICALCISPLLANGEAERAARLVRLLDVTQATTWIESIRAFNQAGVLPQLVPMIPVPPKGPSLPCEVYDEVLRSLAAVSTQALLAALERWPAGTYSAAPLQATLRDMLPCSITEDGVPDAQGLHDGLREHRLLVEALASLHEAQGDRVGAATLLLQVGTSSLFPFLARHLDEDAALRQTMRQNIARLFDFNSIEALELFVKHSAAFPPNDVVIALEPCGRWWQHRYLQLLCHRGVVPSAELHGVRLSLVAEFEPHNLRPFLEQAHRVEDGTGSDDDGDAVELEARDNILGQLQVARSCGSVDAEITLLLRQGHISDALQLCLTQLGDAGTALQLVNAAPAELAPQVWDDLVSFAAGNSQVCAALAVQLDTTSQPAALHRATQAALMKSIPCGCDVPSLTSQANQAMKDAEADRDVHSASLKVLGKATESLSAKLFLTQRRGVAVTPAGQVTNTAERPRDAAPATAGAPWHKIRAPHFQLAMVLRSSSDVLRAATSDVLRTAVENL